MFTMFMFGNFCHCPFHTYYWSSTITPNSYTVVMVEYYTNIINFQSAAVAVHLDLVGHKIRQRLDEIKRREVERLKELQRMKMKTLHGTEVLKYVALHGGMCLYLCALCSSCSACLLSLTSDLLQTHR